MSAQPGPARSEGSGSGAETPTRADPDSPDDDGAAGGSGTGSGSGALVAPRDPKARTAWLRDRLAAALASRPGLAKVKIAYAALDLATGEDLASRDPAKGMTLASNAKLLTSVAAHCAP